MEVPVSSRSKGHAKSGCIWSSSTPTPRESSKPTRDTGAWRKPEQLPTFGAMAEKRAIAQYMHHRFMEAQKMQTEKAAWEAAKAAACAEEKKRIRTIMQFAFSVDCWDAGLHFAFVDPLPIDEAIPRLSSACGISATRN